MLTCPACGRSGTLTEGGRIVPWGQSDGVTVARCGSCQRGLLLRPRLWRTPRIEVIPMPMWNAMQMLRRDGLADPVRR